MSDDAERKERVRQRKLATARELEGRGFVDQAVQSFLKADAPDEAARVLRGAGRPSEAAATLLMALGVDVDGVGSLDEEKRKLAAMAADCFDAVGDKDRAGRIRAQLSGAPASAPAASAAAAATPAARPSAASPPAAAAVARPSVASPASSPASSPAAAAAAVSRPSAASPASSPAAVSRPSAASPASPAAPVIPSSAAGSSQPARPSPSPQRSPSARARDDDEYKAEAGWRVDSAETRQAVEQMIQENLAQGRKGTAARIAWDAGQHARALEWFDELEMHYHAGSCLASLGRKEEGLERMLREPEAGARYRKTCFAIVDLALELGRLDFDIDRYLNRFVQEGPRDRDEVPSYLRLAELYQRMGFERGAQRCFVKILEIDSDNAEAKQKLRELQRMSSSSTASRPPPKRAAPPPAMREGLPSLPTLEEFVALARKHAPGAR